MYGIAGYIVLNNLQDCVAMTLREVWPMAAMEQAHRMAMPGSRVEGTVLHLWYGDEESPVVRLRGIDLAS